MSSDLRAIQAGLLAVIGNGMLHMMDNVEAALAQRRTELESERRKEVCL